MKKSLPLILCLCLLQLMQLSAQPTLENTLPSRPKVILTTASSTHIRASVLTRPYPKNLLKPAVWYHWLYKDSILRSQGSYSGKLLDGPFEEFFSNRSPKTSGSFAQGIKVGQWKYWDHKGTLRKISHWSLSQETGTFILFNEEGQKVQQGRMKDGKLHGRITTFSTADSTGVTHQRYRNGVPVPQRENRSRKAISALKNLF